jgi:phospholipase C
MKKTTLALALSTALLAGSAGAHTDADHDVVPKLDHVFLIMMENHAYSQIMGNSNAPFINQLAQSANLATNYFAVGHPSLTNYLETVGGSNFGIANDNYPNWHDGPFDPSLNSPIAASGTDVETPADIAPFGIDIPAAPFIGETIADQLVAVNKTWKSYQEDLPASGADNVNYSDGSFSNLSAVNQGSVQKLYAVKHNPFVYFANVQANTDPKNGFNNVVGFDGLNGLYADLRSGKVPNFSFIAPNQCHDMHGAGGGSALCASDATVVQMGDLAVKQLVGAIKGSEAWKHGRNAIVVMWDENDFSANPNQVVTLVDTNYGVHGVTSAQPYSHFSLLKTLEAGFGVPCLNHACDSNVNLMSDLFKAAYHDAD